MDKRRYIPAFAAATVLLIAAVAIYLAQLSNTVAANVMSTVDEISRHDVETIEGALDNCYGRLESIAKRMTVYDVETIQEAQEQLNLEAASSALFNAVYLMDEEGVLYSSSYLKLSKDQHTYHELFAENKDHFVLAYDDVNGKLETTKESLIYGIRIAPIVIEGKAFTGMLGRSDLSTIRDQLLIESFDGEGISSVVNVKGYYIVNSSPATDLSGRNNFYDMLEAGHLEGGMTIEDVRRNIADGMSFSVNCVTAQGESLMLSFAPIEGTAWSFIMQVPMRIFDERFTPFVTMTVVMLVVVVVLLVGMMFIIYRSLKRTVSANAESAARAEFLSTMSHEIRTPLNGIIGLNHLMERHMDDKQAMEGYVKKLGRAATYLLSLVNDILDVSKLQAGKVELANAPFNMTAALENVCDMQREPMAERSISFITSEVHLPYPFVVGDEVRVEQVLMNILSNAVKFTPPEGTVTVSAGQALEMSGYRVRTTIRICDTGCGMSESFQEQIFDVFTQERSSTDESQKGTGLGMSISYLLAKQMGGSLSVESTLGEGSCFTVEFATPLNAAWRKAALETNGANATEGASEGNGTSGEAKAATATERTSSADAMTPDEPSDEDNGPVRLLVAEDNELNADIIESILTEEGYEVVLAADGREAVDAFKASPIGSFAAILMDAQMPVLDGFSAAQEIRALNRIDAESVRIFACTASTFEEDRKKALDAGMDDFLPKPLNVPLMLAKLKEVKPCVG